MANEVLNSLLKEYEQKKLKAELDFDKRKEELYQKFPRLQQIENEINSSSILIAKNILLNNNFSLEEFSQKVKELKEEKACLLKKINLPNNFLTPNYECSICKDSGYISKNDDTTDMCSCLKQKLLNISFNKSNIATLDKENFETFDENLFSDEINLAKYHFNISPRQNIRNIKQKCIEFVDNFDNSNIKNLLFTGNVGLRKDFYVELYCKRTT